jgi:hypothetical protein
MTGTKTYGPFQAARRAGLQSWQWTAGVALGLIPTAEAVEGRRWTTEQVDAVDTRAVAGRVGTEQAIGTVRALERLRARIGTEPWIDHDLIDALADTGALPVAGWYRDWPLYLPRDLDQLTPTQLDQANTAADVTRTLTTTQAAARLGIRTIELAHLQRIGLLAPAGHVATTWHTQTPLWAITELDHLANTDLTPTTGTDWVALRAIRPGQRSPLRHLPTPDTSTSGTTQP